MPPADCCDPPFRTVNGLQDSQFPVLVLAALDLLGCVCVNVTWDFSVNQEHISQCCCFIFVSVYLMAGGATFFDSAPALIRNVRNASGSYFTFL